MGCARSVQTQEVLRVPDSTSSAEAEYAGHAPTLLAPHPTTVLREQVFVGRDARLALGLAGARAHADPLQLALQRLLALGLGLLLGGWFLNDSVVSSAKNGAIMLAVIMIIDAFYIGYAYRSNTNAKLDTTFKYATYGSVLSAIVLALAFGYIAI